MKTEDAIVLTCFVLAGVWLGLCGIAFFIFHDLTMEVSALLVSCIYQVLAWFSKWRFGN